jgi:glutamyl-tRNA(Gln) amidotransferase subunit E
MVKKKLQAKYTDSVVLVWGKAEDVRTALAEISIRAREATQGIPNETRQVMLTMDTDFERILPGPDRMYPDTDSPPIPVSETMLAEIEKRRAPTPAEWRAKYEGVINLQLLEQLIDSAAITQFNALRGLCADEPGFIGYLLTALPCGSTNGRVERPWLREVIAAYAAGRLSREAVFEFAAAYLTPESTALERVGRLSDSELRAVIEKVRRDNTATMDRTKRIEYLAGRVKAITGTRADGRDILRLLIEEEGK